MKSTVFTFVLLAIAIHCSAQNWKKDLPSAIKEAAQENKKVLLFFSVPEYCDTCQKLERNIFKSEEFQSYASDKYVLVKIDFSNQAQDLSPEIKEQNLLIVEKYNKDGFFPFVVVLNKDSKIIGKMGVYKNETPTQYMSLLQAFSKT